MNRVLKKIDIIGNVYTCKKGGPYVVEKELYCLGTEYYYQIRFLETGTIAIAEKRNIRNGIVRDYYSKTIYGVACKGLASTKSPEINRVAFKRWLAMIERCYSPKAIMYKSYGAKGVRVSDDWLCFENYIKDIVEIGGFDNTKYLSGEIQLDKDTKVPGNKIYGKEYCTFITRRKNAQMQPSKLRKFEAVNPDGDKFIFYNQSECARKFNLKARTIGKVLNGELKTHHGWRFRYVV